MVNDYSNQWECSVCSALSAQEASACWNCKLPKGAVRTAAAVEASRAARRKLGGSAKVMLYVVAIAVAAFMWGALSVIGAALQAK